MNILYKHLLSIIFLTERQMMMMMMMMSPYKAHNLLGAGLLLLIFFISQLGGCDRTEGASDGNDLILATCKETLYMEVCISSLRSDPRSRGAADVEMLARIALDLTMVHGSKTISLIRIMLKEGGRLVNGTKKDGYMEGCLRDCLEEYSDAVENLRESAEALVKKMYDTVNARVSAAMTDSDACEDGFKEKPGYVSPLAERSQYFYKLCSNALAINKLAS